MDAERLLAKGGVCACVSTSATSKITSQRSFHSPRSKYEANETRDCRLLHQPVCGLTFFPGWGGGPFGVSHRRQRNKSAIGSGLENPFRAISGECRKIHGGVTVACR